MTVMHENELVISNDLVASLIAKQFPRYSGLPLKQLGASGSSNIQFRLGDDLLVRLPRQPDGGASIEKEHRWSELIGAQLPVAVPDIVELGSPGEDYSESWSIVRWIEGEHPSTEDSASLVDSLADVLLAFREIEVSTNAKADVALKKPYRGKTLAKHDRWFKHSLEQCRQLSDLALDLDAAEKLWAEAMKLPGAAEMPDQDRWFHSDIVAENLLMKEGQLVGLLDLGGIGIGDPTVDLHGVWELFDESQRAKFRQRLAIDDDTWLRGRAWALAIALMTFPYYWQTMPGRIQSRLTMARQVLAAV